MKIVRRGALPVGGEFGFYWTYARGPWPRGPAPGSDPRTGRQEDIWQRWVDASPFFIDVETVQPLRVCSTRRTAWLSCFAVLERLPISGGLGCVLFESGRNLFRTTETNQLLPENREFIIDKVRAEQDDMGVDFDGDADAFLRRRHRRVRVTGDFVTSAPRESNFPLEKAPAQRSSTTCAEGGPCRRR